MVENTAIVSAPIWHGSSFLPRERESMFVVEVLISQDRLFRNSSKCPIARLAQHTCAHTRAHSRHTHMHSRHSRAKANIEIKIPRMSKLIPVILVIPRIESSNISASIQREVLDGFYCISSRDGESPRAWAVVVVETFSFCGPFVPRSNVRSSVKDHWLD